MSTICTILSLSSTLMYNQILMDYPSFLEKCQHTKLFKNLNEEARQHLFKVAKIVKYEPQQVVFYSSASENEFYIVDEGELELNLNSGKEKRYKKGNLFGEISVINNSPRMGTMTALTQCTLIKFDGNLLWSEQLIPSRIQLQIFRQLADYVVSYLDNEFNYATEKIIRKGEGVTVEFKGAMSKAGKQKIVETICAFLNTRGGTILIGVEDDSTVIGINDKSERDIDQYKLNLSHMVRDKVGATYASYVQFNVEKYGGKILLRINCFPSKQPAILEDKGEELFFIRSGPSNIKAPSIKEMLNYYDERFR